MIKDWVKITASVLFLCFISAIAYFCLNRAEIYTLLGDFYIKKSDYSHAQKYYEKSYILENKDKHFRENYVNLLINSPLTIDAQERLVDIAEDKVNDAASESAKYFLFNLKREIHNKYPENYIQQAPYNQKIVHWGKIPITYSIKQPKGLPPEFAESVNSAFDAWERASSARIRFEKVGINADIVVNFAGMKVQDPKYGQKYIIAYTEPEIYQKTLERMNVTLNIYSVDGTLFTPEQIYNTALHEVFHALGFMGHSQDKTNIMYMTNDLNSTVDNVKKELTDADKKTLELLYKIRPDITNAKELSYEYIPYPVIGNSAEINYAKSDEAKSYIRKAPTIPAGYIELAQTLINDKNYASAILNLEKAYRLSRNNDTKFMALYNLAVANYYQEDYELSLFYIEKAEEIKEDDSLHVLKAEIYKKQQEYNKSIKEYEYLSGVAPQNIDYAINLANLYIKKYRYIKARGVLKEYLKNNPKDKDNSRLSPYKILLF